MDNCVVDYCFKANSSDSTTEVIMAYFDDIWGFYDSDDYPFWETSEEIKGSIEEHSEPEISFIGSPALSEYLSQFKYYLDIGPIEIFQVLNSLNRPVDLEGYWKGSDYGTGRYYFYNFKTDIKKQKYVISYGLSHYTRSRSHNYTRSGSRNNTRKKSNPLRTLKKSYPLHYEAPRKEIVQILAAKAADEGNTELTAELLELLNEINLGLWPSDGQIKDNQNYEFQEKSSSIKSRLRRDKYLLPFFRDALLENLETCKDLDSLKNWKSSINVQKIYGYADILMTVKTL